MKNTTVNVFAALLIAAALYGMSSPIVRAATATGPMTAFYVRQVTVTATATRIRDLLPTADQTIDGRCNVTVFNPSTTIVNFGGVDVDNSTKFMPICASASCVSDRISVDTGVLQTGLRTQSGSVTAYVAFGGGC